MDRTPICELCIRYGTDKGPIDAGPQYHGYSAHYHRALEARRDSIRRVLEIGICGFRDIPNNVVGASLFVWRDFLPNAEVHGIDCDPRFIFHDQDRIRTELADAYDRPSLTNALYQLGDRSFDAYDLIIDDAVHDPEPQMKLLGELWPHLSVGGVYAMEDVCPYKMPEGLDAFVARFPVDSRTEIVRSHKNEVLLLIYRVSTASSNDEPPKTVHELIGDLDHPFRSEYTIDERGLQKLLDVVLLTRPRYVVELGCGASTLLLGRAVRDYGGRVLSVEHDVREMIRCQEWTVVAGLSEVCSFLYAPLVPTEGYARPWYALPRFVGGSVDLLLVDGPATPQGDPREPALPFFDGSMSRNGTIVVDDAYRLSERASIESLQDLWDVTIEPSKHGIAVLTRRRTMREEP